MNNLRTPFLAIRTIASMLAAAARPLTAATRPAVAILYDQVLNGHGSYPDLITAEATHQSTSEGLQLTGAGELVRLNRYYSLARRSVRYHLKFESDTKAIFQSDKGDFKDRKSTRLNSSH